MNSQLYPLMAQVEDTHWWFCSAGRVFSRAWVCPGARILEPDCGTGGNFEMLSSFGGGYATESDDEACKFASARKTARQ